MTVELTRVQGLGCSSSRLEANQYQIKHFQPDQLLYLWDLLLAYDTMEVFPLLASTVLR